MVILRCIERVWDNFLPKILCTWCIGHIHFSVEDKGCRMPLWMIRSLYDLDLGNRLNDSYSRGRIVQIDKMTSSGFGTWQLVLWDMESEICSLARQGSSYRRGWLQIYQSIRESMTRLVGIVRLSRVPWDLFLAVTVIIGASIFRCMRTKDNFVLWVFLDAMW